MKTWYTDQSAEMVHERLKSYTDKMCEDLFPCFVLTHSGFNRMDESTRFITGKDEIKIVLHLRPISEARVIDDQLQNFQKRIK